MTQGMWMHVGRQSPGDSNLLNDAGNAARGQWSTPAVNEQALRILAQLSQNSLASFPVGFQGFLRRSFQRYIALFLSFASNQDDAVSIFDIAHLDGYEFRVAQSAAVEQLKDSAIPLREPGRVRHAAIEQAVDLFHGGHARQLAR